MLKQQLQQCLKDLEKAVKLMDEAHRKGARHPDLYYYRGTISSAGDCYRRASELSDVQPRHWPR